MLTIKDILEGNVDWDNLELDEDESDELTTELMLDFLKKNTPRERHLLVLNRNWDDGAAEIEWIIDQPDTDKGTALLIYWHLSPGFYKKMFANRQECEEQGYESELESYDRIATLEKNYLSGYYQNQVYAFNPHGDSNGINWAQEYDESTAKAKIPAVMFEALEGEIPDSSGWEEGIPPALTDIFEKISEAVYV